METMKDKDKLFPTLWLGSSPVDCWLWRTLKASWDHTREHCPRRWLRWCSSSCDLAPGSPEVLRCLRCRFLSWTRRCRSCCQRPETPANQTTQQCTQRCSWFWWRPEENISFYFYREYLQATAAFFQDTFCRISGWDPPIPANFHNLPQPVATASTFSWTTFTWGRHTGLMVLENWMWVDSLMMAKSLSKVGLTAVL